MGEQIDRACGRGRKGDVAVQVDVTGEGGGAEGRREQARLRGKGLHAILVELSHGW